MIRIPDIAARYDLDTFLASVSPSYHLYTSNVTVAASVTLASFIEADWPAYLPKPVTTWLPSLIVGGRAVSTADPVLFQRGTGGVPRMVYGYYVTDGSGGPLLWWEPRDAGPLPMDAPTDGYLIRPRLTLREDPTPEV